MKKKITRILALALMAAQLLPAPVVSAGWVDDWLTQKTVNRPDYYSGQRRGYYSGGSFSARWPNTTDYLVTVETPRIKNGCGGIDLFMGGISFINFEYLVNKLKRILTSGAAGAVGFDLALKTLCEQCASTIKSVDALVNQLNAMQIDDCTASQAVVAMLDDGSGGWASMETMGSRLSTSIKENQIGQGVKNLYQSIGEDYRTMKNRPPKTDVDRTVSGCNSEIRDIFLGNNNQGGLLLENVGVGKMGMPSAYVAMIRGLLGDIKIADSEKGFHVSFVPPCTANNPDAVDAFTGGEVFARTADGACGPITDANRDLLAHIGATMTAITTKMKNKAPALTGPENAFIRENPLGVAKVLKLAISTRMEEVSIATMSELTARAYVVLMLDDLYNRADKIMLKAKEVLGKKAVAQTGQGSETCQAEIFGANVDREIENMLQAVDKLKYASRANYNSTLKEAQAIVELMNDMQRTEDKLLTEVSKRFGMTVAQRIAAE